MFIVIFYTLIIIVTIALYSFFINYFIKLTQFDVFFKKCKNILKSFFWTFFIASFIFSIIISPKTSFLVKIGGSFMDGVIFYYVNFFILFVISYYYCYILYGIFKIMKIQNQALISILGFLPSFLLSCIFLGIIVRPIFV